MTRNLIRLSKSCISELEVLAVNSVLEKEYLGMGVVVKEFEELLGDFFGREAICVSNGTAALQLALQGCGVKCGDEVLVPSLTYVATFQAVSALGAIPVACDINLWDCQIDVSDAESRITEKTKAILPVHYSGAPCDLLAVYRLAERYKLRVIEDAAHAFGSLFNKKLIGSFGDVSCFSFDGIKNITSGEGGCIVADNPELLRRLKDLRLLGVENDTSMRFSGGRSWVFDVKEQGWRYHMSDVMAAIGLAQLKRFPEFKYKRALLAKRYDEKLSSIEGVRSLKRDYDSIAPHIYPIIVANEISRDNLRNELLKVGIQTGIHYYPNHLLTYYSNAICKPLPVTESIASTILSLPLHPDLSVEEVDFICESVRTLVA